MDAEHKLLLFSLILDASRDFVGLQSVSTNNVVI